MLRHSYGLAMLCVVLMLMPQASGQLLPLKSLRELRVLTGTWKMQTGSGEIWEQWVAEQQQLTGMSYLVKGQDTTQLEDVRLYLHKGQLHYAPRTHGDNESKRVSFLLVKQTGLQFEFENRQHDFPQRIVYHFVGADSLHAWIEGIVDGRHHQQHYYYQRVR